MLRRIAGSATAASRLCTTAATGWICAGRSFRVALRAVNLTSNQVWGLTKTDEKWSAALEAALMATRRGDLDHGTNAAYVAGCVCKDCREYQRRRMVKNRG